MGMTSITEPCPIEDQTLADRPLSQRTRVTRRGFQAGALALIASTGGAAAQAPGLRLSVRDSCSKARGGTRIADEPNPVVDLEGPRNAAESFQIVLQATGGRARVTLTATDAAGPSGTPLGASAVALFLAHLVTIDPPSDQYGAAGRWPDALVPVTRPIEIGDEAATVWVRITIPADLPPGLYEGAVVIEGGAGRREVRYRLTVHPVVLPTAPTLPLVVGLDWDSIARSEGAGLRAAEIARDVVPAYFALLKSAGAVPFNPFDQLAGLGGQDSEKGGGAPDFSAVDRRLDAILFPGGDEPVALPFALGAPVDTARYPPFTPAWRARAVRYLRQAADHYRARGLLDRAFVYVAEADEPLRAEQVRLIAELHRICAEADPRIRVAQTIHAKCLDCTGSALDVLESPATLWIPNIAFYDGHAVGAEAGLLGRLTIRGFGSGWPGAFEDKVRRSGRPIWWYFNAATGALPSGQQLRYPSLHIDHDAMAHRVIGWMAWEQRISAIGYWMATYWRGKASPWRIVPRGEGDRGTNGDGVLIYPAAGAAEASGQGDPGGPVTSIRLELLREGGQDHRLLCLAERRLGRAAVVAHLRRVFRRLDDFSLDPSGMRAARSSLLRALA